LIINVLSLLKIYRFLDDKVSILKNQLSFDPHYKSLKMNTTIIFSDMVFYAA